MAGTDGPHGVLTLLCIVCGNKRHCDERPQADITCENCGNTVFRDFFTPTEADDATLAHLEQTRRSTALDSIAPETAPDDLRDLNNP